MIANAIARLQEQLSIAEIAEAIDAGGVHYRIGCYQSPTGFYVISCACGWRIDTGKNASQAHALMRSHAAGHASRIASDGE